jgi:hypothetical protein
MIEPVSTSSRLAASAASTRRPLDTPQVQQALARGRQASALLSTLPGPNLDFFAPPVPPGGTQAFAAPARGPGAFSPVGARERLNVPLLEQVQAGRVTSSLLSSLWGPGERVFRGPVPPQFAAGAAAGAAPATATPALPPTAAPLLEAEQRGRTTSALLSALTPAAAGQAYQRETLAPPGPEAPRSWTWEWFA